MEFQIAFSSSRFATTRLATTRFAASESGLHPDPNAITRALPRAAWTMARAGARLMNDYREAPGMGARAAGRAFHRLSKAVCASNRIHVRLDSEIPHGPCILVANHQSYLDPMLVASLVPCLPIARLEVADKPFIGEVARRYGALFVNPSCQYSRYRLLRHVLTTLQEGGTILNFPEGRTSDGSVGAFYSGIFGIAHRAKVAVVPVAIAMRSPLMCQQDQSASAHYLATLRGAPHEVFIRVGQPLPGDLTPVHQAHLARARIQKALGELRAPDHIARGRLGLGSSSHG